MAGKKGFSLKEGMLNNISKVGEKNNSLEAKESFKLEYLNIEKLVPSEKNFYELVNIDELAENIKINGLNSNLLVRPIENDKYELIGGHRRYTALKKLVEEGETKFSIVPCQIKTLNDLDMEIILINDNAQTRELSEVEKLKQVEKLTELYKIKKQNGEKLPGRVREKVAKDLGLSTTQVGRYEKISKSLIPELKELLESEKLTVANASEFAILTEQSQKEILDIINNKVTFNKKEAVELKNKLKKIEEEKEAKVNELSEKLKKLEDDREQKNKFLDEYKIKNEQTLKEVDELKKNMEHEIKKEKSKIQKDLDNEKANIIEEIEKKYKEDIEALKLKVQESKKSEEELKNKLALSKDNKEDYEEIKLNAEVMIKLKQIVSLIQPTISQISSLKKNNNTINDQTLKQISYTTFKMNNFIEEVNKLVNIQSVDIE